MVHSDQLLAQRLGFLGLIPLILGATGPWVLYDHAAWILQAFFYYSAGILAFMAGTVWGVRLDHEKPDPGSLLVSALVALAAIGSLLLPDQGALVTLVAGYLLLLQWERRKIFPTLAVNWYPMLRHRLTWSAVACHLMAYWSSGLPTA